MLHLTALLAWLAWLAWLGGLLAPRPGPNNTFLQIIFPEKIQGNTSDKSEVENEQISYIIPIGGKPYTVHLKQRYFLADNFMVYMYNQGSMSSHSDIQAHCYYQGYIEGYPNSVVILNTCSGLRGILQFENVSFGIEPLESALEFQHILYKLRSENNELATFKKYNSVTEKHPMDYNIFINKKTESPAPELFPLYLEMHIVVDKALYDYLGSDRMTATNKIIEIISLVNSMFNQFKVNIVLASLELWSDKNKISTTGEADELLRRFLEWNQFYLTLRPHDVAYLFIYRDNPSYVGATFPGKMCFTHFSSGIILYPKDITLEAFSVIITQMLGLGLGISYDDPKKCQCSEAICIMNPDAVQFSGVKTFSSCSLSDFKSFISNVGVKCLQNKPQMQRKPVCGNRAVERNEVCDCGTPAQCGPNNCCDPATCRLKQESECLAGSCCFRCKFVKPHRVCRATKHPECDVPEYCTGSSPDCPPDITIHNGHTCKNKYICYNGECHDLDAECEKWYGKGSTNAPFACYEEIHSQTDRFGNCGKERNQNFKYCGWRNLICGRLVCTYPFQAPYHRANTSVIYAYVRNKICITMDANTSPVDLMMVKSGSQCDIGRVCVNRICVEARPIQNTSYFCTAKCSGHGVCDSRGLCNCTDGYLPPNCSARAKGFSLLPMEEGLIVKRASGKTEENLLLSFYVGLPIFLIAIIIIMIMVWYRLKNQVSKEEESQYSNSKSEGNIHTHISRSISESSSQIDASKSTSEYSTQEDTSRSKSEQSTKTYSSSN